MHVRSACVNSFLLKPCKGTFPWRSYEGEGQRKNRSLRALFLPSISPIPAKLKEGKKEKLSSKAIEVLLVKFLLCCMFAKSWLSLKTACHKPFKQSKLLFPSAGWRVSKAHCIAKHPTVRKLKRTLRCLAYCIHNGLFGPKVLQWQCTYHIAERERERQREREHSAHDVLHRYTQQANEQWASVLFMADQRT